MNLKLIGIGVIVAVLVAGGAYLRHSGYQAGKAACEADMAAQVAEATAKADEIEKAAESTVSSMRIEYETIIAAQDERYRDAVARVGPVRVRPQPAGSGKMPPAAGAPAGDTRAAGRDGLSGPAGSDFGRDIGPDLARLTQIADLQTQRLIACQKYAREIADFRRKTR